MGTYIIGDRHGNFEKLVSFSIMMKLTEKDNLIVLGDMGLCWRKDKKDLINFTNLWEAQMINRPMLYFLDGIFELCFFI